MTRKEINTPCLRVGCTNPRELPYSFCSTCLDEEPPPKRPKASAAGCGATLYAAKTKLGRRQLT